MSSSHTVVRLQHFRVEKLFGQFDHNIPLSQDSRITALIAPNGTGKTVCLRLIYALFRRQWSIFASTEFSEVEFTFSNGARVVVKHASPEEQFEEVGVGILIETYPLDGEPDVWLPKSPERTQNSLSRFEHLLPLSRVGPNRWVHDLTRQAFNLQEVVEQFGDRLPESVLAALSSKPAAPLATLIEPIDCHLIETQRLLILPEEDPRRGGTSTLTISRKAQTLKAHIARELTAYASLSQSLDRSFPRRVIAGSTTVQGTDELKESLQSLDELRRQLMEAGILDTEADGALLPPGNIDTAVAAVLSVYVVDTKTKLDFLSRLLARITLFKELIDERFAPKSISVDRESGFTVRRGTEVVVPLEKLSSGEQHQLVLFFELLFELKENALILIDEPELSLHVAWQKKFIPDLQRILSLNKFDVLLATHSPQLIGRWTDLVVELGDVDPA